MLHRLRAQRSFGEPKYARHRKLAPRRRVRRWGELLRLMSDSEFA
jgi:hypothetical protein